MWCHLKKRSTVTFCRCTDTFGEKITPQYGECRDIMANFSLSSFSNCNYNRSVATCAMFNTPIILSSIFSQFSLEKFDVLNHLCALKKKETSLTNIILVVLLSTTEIRNVDQDLLL